VLNQPTDASIEGPVDAVDETSLPVTINVADTRIALRQGVTLLDSSGQPQVLVDFLRQASSHRRISAVGQTPDGSFMIADKLQWLDLEVL
jgi:hypothetical protein